MIFRRAAAATLALGALTLAACSSSGNSGSSPTPDASATSPSSSASPSSSSTPSTVPSSSTSASSSSSTATATGAGAGLAAIVVQRGDVPTTFQAGKPDTDDDSDNDVLPCVGARSTESDEKATVHSQDFSTETSNISSQVTRFGSQASVDSDAKIFSNPKIQSCLSALLKKKVATGLGSGVTTASTKVEVTPGADGGPRNLVSRTTATIVAEKDGKQLPIYVDSVYITGPKIEVEMDFTSYGTRFDPALAATVTSAVAKRAAAA